MYADARRDFTSGNAEKTVIMTVIRCHAVIFRKLTLLWDDITKYNNIEALLGREELVVGCCGDRFKHPS